MSEKKIYMLTVRNIQIVSQFKAKLFHKDLYEGSIFSMLVFDSMMMF